MSFTIIEAEQRSPEWYAARCGRLTGSRAGDMQAKLKSGAEAAGRRDYRIQLAVERLTGVPQESDYINAEMQRGIDLEPAGLAAYEARTGTIVRTTGFLSHNSLMVGCSLDGDIDSMAGILELKCPKSATHYGYLKSGVMPSEYRPQAMHNLWLSGAQWLDFASFDDRFPEKLQLFIVRVYAKDLPIAEYVAEAQKFLAEVAAAHAEMDDMLKEAA